MGCDPRNKRDRGRIFKDHLLQVREQHIPMNMKSIKGSRKPSGMNEDLLTVEVEEGRDEAGGIQIHALHV